MVTGRISSGSGSGSGVSSGSGETVLSCAGGWEMTGLSLCTCEPAAEHAQRLRSKMIVISERVNFLKTFIL